MSPQTIFYGAVINPQSLVSYQAIPNCLIAVSSTGQIEWIVEGVMGAMVQETMAQHGCIDAQVIALKHAEFLMPGFIDTHTHAPQVPNIGSGQQYELLDWLANVTFPMEAKFSDLDFSRRTYESVVRRTIDSGTTTCCYYGSLHLDSTKILADIVHGHGQRAFVGKCNMNRQCPSYYIEPSVEASIADTEALITHIRSLPAPSMSHPLVQPILTPRFAISCTPALLSSLGSLASSDPTLHIQTHISENPSEVSVTKSLFPHCTSYADVYDHYGLLRKGTILAHGVHLGEDEVKLIKEKGAGISHCPTSNFNLSSGIARVGEFLDRGIKVGLGTDVSGGFCPSILTAIQHASIASKVLSMSKSTAYTPQSVSHNFQPFANRQLPVSTLLHLATLGGSQVCGLADNVGNFEVGKNFDALVVDIGDGHGNPGLWGLNGDEEKGEKALEEMLERFLFCGDDRNIGRVYIQGRFVGGREFGKWKH